MRRGNDDGQVRLLGLEFREQCDAIHAGHTNVADHHHGLFQGQSVDDFVTGLKNPTA